MIDEDDIGGHDDADHEDVDARGRFESEDDDIDQAGGYQE